MLLLGTMDILKDLGQYLELFQFFFTHTYDFICDVSSILPNYIWIFHEYCFKKEFHFLSQEEFQY